MAKKVLFSKEIIVDRSFELFKEEGIEAISARNVAKMLDSSPAPIYKSIGSMSESEKRINKKSKRFIYRIFDKKKNWNKIFRYRYGNFNFCS